MHISSFDTCVVIQELYPKKKFECFYFKVKFSNVYNLAVLINKISFCWQSMSHFWYSIVPVDDGRQGRNGQFYLYLVGERPVLLLVLTETPRGVI